LFNEAFAHSQLARLREESDPQRYTSHCDPPRYCANLVGQLRRISLDSEPKLSLRGMALT